MIHCRPGHRDGHKHLVGGHDGDVQVIDIGELRHLRGSRTRHAPQLRVATEEILRQQHLLSGLATVAPLASFTHVLKPGESRPTRRVVHR